jgi:quinoprotein glucose dehydrogenase
MAVDEKRGLVFAPTGSAAFDFYGANRVGDNLFANSLLALRADTGKRVWHFQVVRHDVWDRDLPAQPTLVRVLRDGRLVDAVAQITKSGYVFVFERETGRTLFPIEHRAVPKSPDRGGGAGRDAAGAAAAAPLRAPGAERGDAHAPHSGSARGSARAVQEAPQRRPVHAAFA